MHIIYSLPFFVLSVALIVLFEDLLSQISMSVSGFIGVALGFASICAGMIIDAMVSK